MATAAYQKWDQVENACRYEKARNVGAMCTYLNSFNTAAHAPILFDHIERFGCRPRTFEVIQDDAAAQRAIGLTFAQIREALGDSDCMYYRFTTGYLVDRQAIMRLETYRDNFFDMLLCRLPTEKIVITAEFGRQEHCQFELVNFFC